MKRPNLTRPKQATRPRQARTSEPLAQRIVAGVTHDFDLTPRSARVFPWTLEIRSADYKRNRPGSLRGHRIFLMPALTAGKDSTPEIDYSEVIPRKIWIESEIEAREHESLVMGGTVSIERLEVFARDLLEVIAEAKRRHPQHVGVP